jgi:uncharacterized protein (UPF0297 family)
MPRNIYIEENGFYQIDCSAAVWSTDQIHDEYHSSGLFLSDVDFATETDNYVYLIEYKNGLIPKAITHSNFDPHVEEKIKNVLRKFYDSLHYQSINGINKPVKYVYIVEYKNADTVTRKMLRDKIILRLPFKLQQNKKAKIIESFDVVSIAEWNRHDEYKQFPLTPVINT